MIKLSDYVADFLSKTGVSHVFTVSGGACLHLIHSIAHHKDLEFITPHHEQAAAMAADGYFRTSGKMGVALSTSGPGATNLITGIAGCYYDSLPVMFLTGQVSTFRMTNDTGVRQIGFQETPIVEMCKSITKYAVTIKDPYSIRYELEKAIFIAFDGRPGPVLIDIPDNLQREMIDSDRLEGFSQKSTNKTNKTNKTNIKGKFFNLLNSSQRPVFVMGWGVHLSKAEKSVLDFARALNIPVALTWGAADLLDNNDPIRVGTFGTHGTRYANFAVQNADLVISLGARLDTKSTGTPISTFARAAKKIVVDIDEFELNKFKKFGLEIDLCIQNDVGEFVKLFNDFEILQHRKDYSDWFNQIKEWKDLFLNYDSVPNEEKINPYDFFRVLSNCIHEDTNLFIDTGCSIAWGMQSLKIKEKLRVFHDFNNTAMGWALPASIGGYFADPDKNLIAVIGDGSFMMSLHELSTIKHHNIPLKIFLINNGGYSMIQQTQDQWLKSEYFASSKSGGLSFPLYPQLAQAFGFEYFEIDKFEKMEMMISEVLQNEKPSFCNVLIPSEARVMPQVKFGYPNEDMEPLLPRDLFKRQMIIETLDVSNN